TEPPKPADPPAETPAKAASGKYRFGELELSTQEISDLIAHKAARDAGKLSAPQSPDAYKVELPATFQKPQGVDLQLNQNDPMWPQARAWAHKNGLSQEAFVEAIGLVAGRDLITQQQVTTARNAEVAKLGATGPARLDAVEAFYRGLLGSDAAAKAM